MLDTATGALVATIAVGMSPFAIAVDVVHGRAIVLNSESSSGAAGSFSLIDTHRNRPVRTVSLPAKPITVACDEVAGRALIGLDSGVVSIVDTVRGTILSTVKVGRTPAAIAVDSGHHRVFITDRTSQLRILDSQTGRIIRTVSYGRALFALAIDSRSNHVFVADRGKTPAQILMIDRQSGRLLRAIPVRQGFDPVTILANERAHTLFVVNAGMPGTVIALNSDRGQLITMTHVGQAPSDVAVDSVMQRVYVANAGDDTLSVLDTGRGRMIRTIPVLHDPVLLALDASRHRLLVIGFGLPPSADLAGKHDPSLLERLAALFHQKDVKGNARLLDTEVMR